MKTGNFDVVLEMHEELINKGLAAVFYSGYMFKKGVWKPSTDKLPNSIKNIAEIKYELRLKGEPLIDYLTDKKVRLLISAEAFLDLCDGYEIEFDVNFGIEGTIVYEKSTDQLMLDLTELHLTDFKVDNKNNLPLQIFNAVNEILRLIVIENLAHKWEILDMKTPLFSAKLPKMPEGDGNRVPVTFGGLKTFNQKILTYCFNLLDYNGGNINNVANFIGGNNYAIGISEKAIHRVFDFWWERTTFDKSITKNKTYDIPVIDTFLDFCADIVDIAASLATAGFLETDFAVEDIWIEYGATATVLKPNFDLKNGNKIEINNSSLKISAWATVKARVSVSIEVDTSGFIPDSWTPWEDDVEISKKTTTTTLFSLSLNNLEAKIKEATGKVFIDADNQLVGEIEQLEIEVDLGSEWYTSLPETIINEIVDFMENMVLEKVKSLVLFPAIIVKQIPKIDFTLEADINLLDIDEQETFIGANIEVKELKTPIQPVPKYIANKNPKSKEVHRSDCISVQRMSEANKVGYYVLYDALRDGYDGCKKCIPEYHTR